MDDEDERDLDENEPYIGVAGHTIQDDFELFLSYTNARNRELTIEDLRRAYRHGTSRMVPKQPK
jgi:hypothetical protein